MSDLLCAIVYVHKLEEHSLCGKPLVHNRLAPLLLVYFFATNALPFVYLHGTVRCMIIELQQSTVRLATSLYRRVQLNYRGRCLIEIDKTRCPQIRMLSHIQSRFEKHRQLLLLHT